MHELSQRCTFLFSVQFELSRIYSWRAWTRMFASNMTSSQTSSGFCCWWDRCVHHCCQVWGAHLTDKKTQMFKKTSCAHWAWGKKTTETSPLNLKWRCSNTYWLLVDDDVSEVLFKKVLQWTVSDRRLWCGREADLLDRILFCKCHMYISWVSDLKGDLPILGRKEKQWQPNGQPPTPT